MTYKNRILTINLTSEAINDFKITDEDKRKFLGGSGLACKLLLDAGIERATDPLGPDNAIVFMTGPLVGTPGPSTGRFTVSSKSPLTGLWGESNSGGKFGPELKFAGFDGLMITGKSEEPVYIQLIDGRATVENADSLWGKGFFETERILKGKQGLEKSSVAAIGQGGENLIKFASIINDGGRAAGRTGMGAVMGSKRLKAIVALGSDRELDYHDREKFDSINKEARKIAAKENMTGQMYSELGTSGYVDVSSGFYGAMSTKYYTEGEWDAWGLSGPTLNKTIFVKRRACFKCPIGCWRIVEVKEGKYTTPETMGPEYETLGAFGSNLLVDNIEGVAAANYLCNDLGIDTLETGNTVGFLYYLAQENKLPEGFAFELPLEWGNIDTAIELARLIGTSTGIGKQLADGPHVFARKHGLLDYLVHVNGQTPPYHDPRAFASMAVALATAPRGADHDTADMYTVEIGLEVPEYGISSPDRFTNKGKGRITALFQNYRAIYSSAIICIFSDPTTVQIKELINATTGFNYTLEELLQLGERVFTLKRLFNLKMGYDPAGEKLPKLYLNPIKGPTEEHVPDLELQLKEWYEFRDYDRSTGYPSAEKLAELGLTGYVNQF
ncbi:MAG: aldehyde ferredoxin oxidoreductase family protein [Candidatus Odinarchaeota archaeon]